MTGGAPLKYEQLTPGFTFPPVQIELKRDIVTEYLRAIHSAVLGENAVLLEDGREAVPPTAAGVLGMRSLLEKISLPEGSIHVSQEFSFKRTVAIGDTVVCQASILRKQERGPIRLLTMDVYIKDMSGNVVINGRTLVTLPVDDGK